MIQGQSDKELLKAQSFNISIVITYGNASRETLQKLILYKYNTSKLERIIYVVTSFQNVFSSSEPGIHIMEINIVKIQVMMQCHLPQCVRERLTI